MGDANGFLLQHGYAVLFALVLADQLGVPLPAIPFLIAAGAIARAGQLDLFLVMSVAVFASVAAHTVWYEAARHGRGDVLTLVCRLSLEPDRCARGARDFFTSWGAAALIIANFMPGFAGVVVQPIAAIAGMSRPRFFALNFLGAALWVAAFVGLGYGFSASVEDILQLVVRFGVSGMQLLVVLCGVYIVWKVVRRQLLYRELRMARITPEELKRRLDAAEPTVIIDLRHAMEFATEPGGIPGSLRVTPEELEVRFSEIPTHGEVVLYCSCPNEASSARSALRLKRHGVERVRPLEGGIQRWRELGYPLVGV
jgi:membrane protein DedA with SNARE-associated domain/rhodanese-related sulfurtransferase